MFLCDKKYILSHFVFLSKCAVKKMKKISKTRTELDINLSINVLIE